MGFQPLPRVITQPYTTFTFLHRRRRFPVASLTALRVHGRAYPVVLHPSSWTSPDKASTSRMHSTEWPLISPVLAMRFKSRGRLPIPTMPFLHYREPTDLYTAENNCSGI